MSDILNDEPRPTPEEEEQWERERLAREAAKIEPFRAVHAQLVDTDGLLAQTMYELTMLELMM